MLVKVVGLKSFSKKDGTAAKIVFFVRSPNPQESKDTLGHISGHQYLEGAAACAIVPDGLKPGMDAEFIYDFDGFRSSLSAIQIIKPN